MPGWLPLACEQTASGQHFVLGRDEARLRLCLRHASSEGPACILLAHDDFLDVRFRAASLYARAATRKAGTPPPGVCPTAYQRSQLCRLLHIADALALGASARDIAHAIVFPRHPPLTGPAWKGSGERRHALRLIRQARLLTSGGHIGLLARG